MSSERKSRLPLTVAPRGGGRDLAEEMQSRHASYLDMLREHGALLFRGFDVADVAAFERFSSAVSARPLDYVYGSTPRTALSNRIFTATEYPANEEIPLHNENSYQSEWPLLIALCCLVPSTRGGETPICDMRTVTAAIGTTLLDEFAERGVRYVRHYRPIVDVPWQQVFRTSDPAEVARFCAAHDIAHEWLDEETLRTAQVCQGAALHPTTGERVFFNQAHLFHVSSLGDYGERAMIDLFGRDRLPRHACFGDDAEIPRTALATVRAAFRDSSSAFPWQPSDVLLLDNMQFGHGRRPYSGARKVIVALMEPHSPERVAVPASEHAASVVAAAAVPPNNAISL
jgi:hypothetical protein